MSSSYPFLSGACLDTGCSPEALLHNLETLGVNTPDHLLILGYSGGVDSTVLLDLLASARAHITATLWVVHINHNLQEEARGWQAHCQSRCEQLSMPFDAHSVTVAQSTRVSLEAAARTARYSALTDMASARLSALGWEAKTAVILTAHHQEDQAETLLLQLIRGAGGKGLSSMPVCKRLGENILQARPMLACAKASIVQYARQNKLSWLDDPTNQSCDFDRNYVRNEVMPVLRERFPQVDSTFARSAQLLAEQGSVIGELIDYTGLNFNQACLGIPELLKMTPLLRAELIRHWLTVQGRLMPSHAVMKSIQGLLTCSDDKQGEVVWGKTNCLRTYDGQLWLIDEVIHSLAIDSHPNPFIFDAQQGLNLNVTNIDVMLSAQTLIDMGVMGGECEVVFNLSNATKVYLPNRGHSTSLKNVFQSMRVPPWLRAYCPLVRVDGIVIAVININDYITRAAEIKSSVLYKK